MLTELQKKAAQAIVKGIKKNRKRIRIGIDAIIIDLLSRFLPVRYPKIVLPLFRKAV